MDNDRVLGTDALTSALLSAAVGMLPRQVADLLDLGSGSGRLTGLCRKARPNTRIVGIDPAPVMIDRVRRRFAADPDVTFELGAAEDLSRFADESFDVVISGLALHHLELDAHPRVAREILRVLRPGGRFLNADQFCRVMGPAGSAERAMDVLELLTDKAKYYLSHAGFERMLLQLDALPRYLREDGEVLATPDYWSDTLLAAGFASTEILGTTPIALYNRVVLAIKSR